MLHLLKIRRQSARRLRWAVVVLGLGTLLIWHRSWVIFGLRQAQGQYNLMTQSRPLDQVMADPAFPDSLKARLRLVNRSAALR